MHNRSISNERDTKRIKTQEGPLLSLFRKDKHFFLFFTYCCITPIAVHDLVTLPIGNLPATVILLVLPGSHCNITASETMSEKNGRTKRKVFLDLLRSIYISSERTDMII